MNQERVVATRGSAKLKGLGDAVAVVANPIARVLRIDTEKCGCKQRQEALNRAFPFKA